MNKVFRMALVFLSIAMQSTTQAMQKDNSHFYKLYPGRKRAFAEYFLKKDDDLNNACVNSNVITKNTHIINGDTYEKFR